MRPAVRGVMREHGMSALGHERTFAVQKGMSALPPRADIDRSHRDVRFVPEADILPLARSLRRLEPKSKKSEWCVAAALLI